MKYGVSGAALRAYTVRIALLMFSAVSGRLVPLTVDPTTGLV